jgi:hypothetical protein
MKVGRSEPSLSAGPKQHKVMLTAHQTQIKPDQALSGTPAFGGSSSHNFGHPETDDQGRRASRPAAHPVARRVRRSHPHTERRMAHLGRSRRMRLRATWHRLPGAINKIPARVGVDQLADALWTHHPQQMTTRLAGEEGSRWKGRHADTR